MKKSTLGIFLIAIGISFFITYVHWGENHNDLSGGYAMGIWFMSAFFCVSGVCALFDKD